MAKFLSKKKIIPIILGIVIVSSAFLGGYVFGVFTKEDSAYSKILSHKQISLELSSNDTQNQLRQYFPEKLNFTQLIVWESKRINYTLDRTVHEDPVEILDYGKGACGEFSILYVSICIANDIPARLFIDPNIDHVWAEVNPSKDGITWIHVEVTDSCVGVQKGTLHIYENPPTINNPDYYKNKNLQLVLAFQINEGIQVQIVDRTSYYAK